MKLLTKEIINKLPALGSQDGKDAKDVPIVVKFFCTWNNWTWYATEGEQQDDTWVFFGLVRGHEVELGYFSLAEIESVKGPFGLKIERDMYFGEHTLAEAKEERI